MHVGYGSGFQHLGGYSDRQFMREELGNCLMAEELGMDSIWATEHHFDNYSISPDVPQLMSYLAGKTKRVKLGSMVIVVPWNDPMRLAEQISLLDHYSDGRFILGVGRGWPAANSKDCASTKTKDGSASTNTRRWCSMRSRRDLWKAAPP